MDTRTLCLGALTFGDASGYELKKVMEQSFGHFLDVSYAAIYPALAALHRDGLVDCEEIEQRGKPDKKRYHIKPAGREAFRRALLASPGRHRLRSEFLALVFFADFLPGAHLQDLIQRRLTDFEAMIVTIDELLARPEPLQPGIRFAAGYGRAVCQAAARYLRDNRHLLDHAPDPAIAGTEG